MYTGFCKIFIFPAIWHMALFQSKLTWNKPKLYFPVKPTRNNNNYFTSKIVNMTEKRWQNQTCKQFDLPVFNYLAFRIRPNRPPSFCLLHVTERIWQNIDENPSLTGIWTQDHFLKFLQITCSTFRDISPFIVICNFQSIYEISLPLQIFPKMGDWFESGFTDLL